MVFTCAEAIAAANRLGYPVLVRPSYCAWRAGECTLPIQMRMSLNISVLSARVTQSHPILVDKYIHGDGKSRSSPAVCDSVDSLIPEHHAALSAQAFTPATVFPFIRQSAFPGNAR